MRLTFDEYDSLTEKLQSIPNPNPSYVPSQEEIDLLWSKTQALRPVSTEDHSMEESFKTGRPDTYLETFHGILPSKPGEPFLNEEDVLLYLVYLSLTTSPSTPDAKENHSNMISFICSHLILYDMGETNENTNP